MTNNKMDPEVDEFLRETKNWRLEFTKLRMIILSCELTEELKWGVPCYTYQQKNIVLIHGFKDYCALLFIKGALLQDRKGILVQQTANVQAGRQIRFINLAEIVAMEATLKDYVFEAIAIEDAGLKVELKKSTEFSIPEELQRKFDAEPCLKTAFTALTLGRQRAYLLYFSEPKQTKTREARIEKSVPQILEGKGLNDAWHQKN